MANRGAEGEGCQALLHDDYGLALATMCDSLIGCGIYSDQSNVGFAAEGQSNDGFFFAGQSNEGFLSAGVLPHQWGQGSCSDHRTHFMSIMCGLTSTIERRHIRASRF